MNGFALLRLAKPPAPGSGDIYRRWQPPNRVRRQIRLITTTPMVPDVVHLFLSDRTNRRHRPHHRKRREERALRILVQVDRGRICWEASGYSGAAARFIAFSGRPRHPPAGSVCRDIPAIPKRRERDVSSSPPRRIKRKKMEERHPMGIPTPDLSFHHDACVK
jgi:hypothetical protein